MSDVVTCDEVITRIDELPSFPTVVMEIIATLDDPDASLKVLATHIEHDPVITGRLLALANSASSKMHRSSAVRNVYTATSLIGLSRVRELVLLSSVRNHMGKMDASPGFWYHSAGVGISGIEIAIHAGMRGASDAALIAGLLHDIGQLWLSRCRTDPFQALTAGARTAGIAFNQLERECFGVDHGLIGAWLGEQWGLPQAIVAAIGNHHDPDAALGDPLVAVVHIAEVVANAIDLGRRPDNTVSRISRRACEALRLDWDDSAHALFGRIEGRSRLAESYFDSHQS